MLAVKERQVSEKDARRAGRDASHADTRCSIVVRYLAARWRWRSFTVGRTCRRGGEQAPL